MYTMTDRDPGQLLDLFLYKVRFERKTLRALTTGFNGDVQGLPPGPACNALERAFQAMVARIAKLDEIERAMTGPEILEGYTASDVEGHEAQSFTVGARNIVDLEILSQLSMGANSPTPKVGIEQQALLAAISRLHQVFFPLPGTCGAPLRYTLQTATNTTIDIAYDALQSALIALGVPAVPPPASGSAADWDEAEPVAQTGPQPEATNDAMDIMDSEYEMWDNSFPFFPEDDEQAAPAPRPPIHCLGSKRRATCDDKEETSEAKKRKVSGW